MAMSFEEWLKSAERREKMVTVEMSPGKHVEMICRVNSKNEFYHKLAVMSDENAGEEVFSGEWFDPLDHSKRIFSGRDEMNSVLSPAAYHKMIEAWTLANTGKAVSLGELDAPAEVRTPRSALRGSSSRKSLASSILTFLKTRFQ